MCKDSQAGMVPVKIGGTSEASEATSIFYDQTSNERNEDVCGPNPMRKGRSNRTFKLVDILDGVVIKRNAARQQALELYAYFEGPREAYCAQCRCQGSGS